MPSSKAQLAKRQAILDRNEPVFQEILKYRKSNPSGLIQFECIYPGHAQAIRSRLNELGIRNIIISTAQNDVDAVFSDPDLAQLWSIVEQSGE